MEPQNLILTFTWKNKHTRIARSTVRKNNYKVRLAVTIFKIYYKTYVIKNVILAHA